MKIKKIILALMFICFFFGSLAQTSLSQTKPFTDYQISSERYFTDSNGSVNMFVNVWGKC